MKAQQEEERTLKKAAHQYNPAYLSDDVAINIEGPTTSLEIGEIATTAASPLQEDDELSDPKKDEKDPETDEEEMSVTVKPKSKKQVTQSENLELKVSHKCLSIVITSKLANVS